MKLLAIPLALLLAVVAGSSPPSSSTAAGRLDAAQNCVLQSQKLDVPENNCGICVHTILVGGQSSANCESPCNATFTYTNNCLTSSVTIARSFPIKCGKGAEHSWDCQENDPYAGYRFFCTTCQE